MSGGTQIRGTGDRARIDVHCHERVGVHCEHRCLSVAPGRRVWNRRTLGRDNVDAGIDEIVGHGESLCSDACVRLNP